MRLLLLASALFGGAVLLTGLPVSALLAQHRQLSSTTAELRQLQAADRSLSAQSKRLSDPGTVSGLARAGFGMVPPGEKAYVILPPSGASPAVVAGSGHVPLEGPPVVPGSAQSQSLLGAGEAVASGDPAAPQPTGRHASSSTATSHSGSFWCRVLHTLEFWR
jgi:cell division protein FtsB